MDKYEFTKCDDCIHYGKNMDACYSCKRSHGCMFEKKTEWLNNHENFPALLCTDDSVLIVRDRGTAIAFLTMGYRVAKSTDMEKVYFDRISK